MTDFVKTVSHDVMNQRGPGNRTGGSVTHPGGAGPSGSATSFIKNNDVRARYKMFDLAKGGDVEELEKLMTDACYGGKMIREERWSHDKDGYTIVTVSWLDVEKKQKKKPAREQPPEGTAQVT